MSKIIFKTLYKKIDMLAVNFEKIQRKLSPKVPGC